MSYVRTGKNGTDSLWTDAMIAELKRRWMVGEHADDIAEAIGVGRNALNGKVHRLGLPLRRRVRKRGSDAPPDRRFTWSDAMKMRLKELFDAGVTCAEMGARLRVSKNAVTNQMHRMGLARPSPIIRDPNRVAQRKPPQRVIGPTLPPMASVDAGTGTPQTHTISSAADVDAAPTPALTQSPRQCMFPLWPHNARPTHVYCAEQRTHGSYCYAHFRRCCERVVDMRGRTILAVAAE